MPLSQCLDPQILGAAPKSVLVHLDLDTAIEHDWLVFPREGQLYPTARTEVCQAELLNRRSPALLSSSSRHALFLLI